VSNVYERAVIGLGRGLCGTRPGLVLSRSGAVSDYIDNLIPETNVAWFRAELEAGDGRELEGKFRAAHSSSALAVNGFARFKMDKTQLRLGAWSGFDDFQFEAKCPTGIRGRKAPNLDLLATSASRIVGVESKCTEYLRGKDAVFSQAYDDQITDSRRQSAWFRAMQDLIAKPRSYEHLDAAQLVKHAFGLSHCFPDKPVVLLYLYWEPVNAGDFPEFVRHRDEVDRFSRTVAAASPAFASITYRDLWQLWASSALPAWLLHHVTALRARYEIVI